MSKPAEFKNLSLSFLAKMWSKKTLSPITCPNTHSITFQMQCHLPQLLFSVCFSTLRTFSNHLSGRSFYSCLFQSCFLSEQMHVVTATIKTLDTSIVTSLPSQVMFKCIFGCVGGWVSMWLQIIFYSKKFERTFY